MNLDLILRRVVLVGVFCIPFIPLVVANFFFFPYITGKNFAFRIITEIIFGAWFILALRDPRYRPKFSLILASVVAFLVVIGIADVLSVNPFKSFWSNYERMEGYITILHLGAYFVVASSVLSTQKLWRLFASTSLGVSVIIGSYAALQYVGLLTTQQGDRPDSTLGNATYLAGYMLFSLFVAAFLFMRSRGSRTAEILYGASALFSAFIVYTTASRGAVLGLFAGVLVAALLIALFERENRRLRMFAVGVIAALVIIAGLLATVRNTAFVKESHVLGRIASISLEAGKSRFLVWNMAWQGFKERPVFGWGQESFNFVFNKYYDPGMYDQESWFDRVHSVYLDWLIAGGLLGLLAYLALYATALLALFRSPRFLRSDRAILTGLFTAFAVYSIFVFDNIANYLIFFSLLAFVHTQSTEDKEPLLSLWRPKITLISHIVVPAILIVTLLLVYAVNAKGILGAYTLVRGLKSHAEGPKKNLEYFKKVIKLNSFGVQEAREQLTTVTNSIANTSVDAALKQEFLVLAHDEMQKQIDRVPEDTRFYLFMASLLDTYRQYPAAVPYLRKALELSPRKQITLFETGSNLLNQGQERQALVAFKTAYELEPKFRDAALLYAVGFIYVGDEKSARELLTKTYGTHLVFDQRLLQAYARRGGYSQVIAILEKQIAETPNEWQARVSLAIAYVQVDKRKQAIEMLSKAVELNPAFKTQGEFYINEIRAGRNPFTS